MRRLTFWDLVGAVVLLIGIWLSIAFCQGTTQADAAEMETERPALGLGHHQGPFFPINRAFYPQMLEMERTGEWVWHYVQLCSSGNIYLDVQGAFLDSIWRYGILMPEVPGQGQANISDCAASFVGRCGAEAVACVGADFPGYPVNCNARYNGPYMATFYSFDSRKAIPKHEWMHCSARRAEDYDDDRNDGTPSLRCIPSQSIMGCGPNAPKDYTSVDDNAWRQEHKPRLFSGRYGYWQDATGTWAFYCGADDDRGTRVAVMVRAPTGEVYWSGNHLPVTPGCHSIQFVGDPGWTLLFNPENAISWFDPLMRWDVEIVRL